MTEKTNFIQKNDDQRMSSLEIAEITGKPHNDLMKAIRKMEVAWHNVNQGKFSLVTYTDAKGEDNQHSSWAARLRASLQLASMCRTERSSW